MQEIGRHGEVKNRIRGYKHLKRCFLLPFGIAGLKEQDPEAEPTAKIRGKGEDDIKRIASKSYIRR